MFCHYMNAEDARGEIKKCLKKWEGLTEAMGEIDEDGETEADTFGWMISPDNKPGEKYTLKDYLHNG